MADGNQQRTLKRAVSCNGVGLHSGQPVTLRLVPAPVDHGLQFARVDLPDKPAIPARGEFVTDTSLATTLSLGPAKVATVEHVLAAVSGLGIDNLRIEVDGPEVPIMDGSAAPFVRLIREAGLREQGQPKTVLVIRRPVTVSDGDKTASFLPDRRFRIECTIDFKHPLISDQQFSVEVNERLFLKEVAPARTFGFKRDVEHLRKLGLAKGGSLENAVVVDDFSILNPEGLRFADEFVRHKLLDAIGDVALLGRPVIGLLSAYKTGHALNQKLVAKVLSDPANYELVRARAVGGPAVWDELEPALAPSAA